MSTSRQEIRGGRGLRARRRSLPDPARRRQQNCVRRSRAAARRASRAYNPIVMKTAPFGFAVLLSFVLAAAGGPAASPAAGSQEAVTAFVNVSVIPMDREVVLEGQTVIVRGGRIAELGPAAKMAVPDGAARIDGAGRFLMPALAEMHAHIPGGKADDALVERTLFLYVAGGIGTIRGMLGDPRHLEYRERAARGDLVSPRIYTSGPSFNGQSARDEATAVSMVRAQKRAGYDLLKIHPGIARGVFEALDRTAREEGIRYAGHVPLDLGLDRALELHYWTIDHADGYVEAMSKDPMSSQFFGVNLVNGLDESRLAGLVERTKKSGTWIVPTQVLFDNLMNDESAEAMAKRPEMQYVAPPAQLKQWMAQKQKFLEIPPADRMKFLEVRRRILEALYDAGVPFALGSDAPQMWNVPGFSIHRELESMVAAGLTPFQALETGTASIARHFGERHDAGTIAAGRRADLVLLDANPLESIRNSSRIAGVMVGGRWLSRQALDDRLAEGR
jgi:hypothetical protein